MSTLKTYARQPSTWLGLAKLGAALGLYSTGVVTFYLCESAQFPPVLTAALVGIAGHMGNRGLFLIEKFLSNKIK